VSKQAARLAKARSLLGEGALLVRDCHQAHAYFDAIVTLEPGVTVHVRHSRNGGWSCTCPSFRACVHTAAAALIFEPPAAENRA
jgi:hypothetical protein